MTIGTVLLTGGGQKGAKDLGDFLVGSIVLFAHTAQLILHLAGDQIRLAQGRHLAPALFVEIELKMVVFKSKKRLFEPGIFRTDSPGRG